MRCKSSPAASRRTARARLPLLTAIKNQCFRFDHGGRLQPIPTPRRTNIAGMSNDPIRIVVSATTKSQTSISNGSAFRRFVRNGWVGSSTACQPAAVGFSISVVVQASQSRVILLHLGTLSLALMRQHQQVIRARRNVPEATFLEADMCELAFEFGSFHAVGAFYSITHIPATQQGPLIANIAAWLKPGGMFVASFGSGAAGEWIGNG
jgi:SAM-dependent methyltransferase